ncbi:LytTr DNA-binding domain-containing protein [Salegentibacter echinorum]|uniref:LytTr DNA-binding domain-containing protein n=1 Tax=Salegentibacter echinorum TaxID=1073325 RepID=A0A1M5K0J3_SALEC|nr:LytTR family DNA-binding domain-containing protein [Salegentibacter echinorum]SHG46294.1 LytTr DNA-binding domain-containing protein [Salegentibacter echinorum]
MYGVIVYTEGGILSMEIFDSIIYRSCLLEDIIFIKSDSEYVHYQLEDDQKIMALQSLNKLSTKLPDYFLQVHRSYIVNARKVTGLKGRDLLLSENIIPVSDSYYEKVKKELFGS